jgi:hypothetical protein
MFNMCLSFLHVYQYWSCEIILSIKDAKLFKNTTQSQYKTDSGLHFRTSAVLPSHFDTLLSFLRSFFSTVPSLGVFPVASDQSAHIYFSRLLLDGISFHLFRFSSIIVFTPIFPDPSVLCRWSSLALHDLRNAVRTKPKPINTAVATEASSKTISPSFSFRIPSLSATHAGGSLQDTTERTQRIWSDCTHQCGYCLDISWSQEPAQSTTTYNQRCGTHMFRVLLKAAGNVIAPIREAWTTRFEIENFLEDAIDNSPPHAISC